MAPWLRTVLVLIFGSLLDALRQRLPWCLLPHLLPDPVPLLAAFLQPCPHLARYSVSGLPLAKRTRYHCDNTELGHSCVSMVRQYGPTSANVCPVMMLA